MRVIYIISYYIIKVLTQYNKLIITIVYFINYLKRVLYNRNTCRSTLVFREVSFFKLKD